MDEALIWPAVAFVAGAVLLMERRCLGQRAFVQPLTLCLAAGLITARLEAAIWLGTTLQMLAAGDSRRANWALAGLASALALLALDGRVGELAPGDPAALGLLIAAVTAGLAARILERRLARIDTESSVGSVFDAPDPERGLNALIRRRLLRTALYGGIGAVAAGTIAAAAVLALVGLEPPAPLHRIVVAVVVPALGVAAAVGAHSGIRYVGIAGIGVIATLLTVVMG